MGYLLNQLKTGWVLSNGYCIHEQSTKHNYYRLEFQANNPHYESHVYKYHQLFPRGVVHGIISHFWLYCET